MTSSSERQATVGEGARRLLLFTRSYPFGLGEAFLEPELSALCAAFDEVVVMPLVGHGRPRPLPAGARLIGPLSSATTGPRLLGGVLGERPPLPTLAREIRKAFAPSPRGVRRLRRLVGETLLSRQLLRHPGLRALLYTPDRPTVAYFYWGLGSAGVAALRPPPVPVVVRLHGHDVYPERNDGYLPLRSALVAAGVHFVTVSRHGARALLRAHPEAAPRVHTHRLGVADRGRARPSADGVLRVLSCAFVHPVKRLPLLIEALSQLSSPFHWTHLGGGDGLGALRAQAARALPAGSFELPGDVDQDALVARYLERPVDVFVNTSASEGLPVSVMEALSFGVPVLAPDVGGMAELVPASQLLPAALDAPTLASALEGFVGGALAGEAPRQAARDAWAAGASLDNHTRFATFLASQLPR